MERLDHNDRTLKLYSLLGFVVLLFAILLVRLFYLQITTRADYERESEQNRISQKRVKAMRGRILTRGGEVLARNRASYTIYLRRSNSARRDAQSIAALQEAIGGHPIQYSRRHSAIRLKHDVDFPTVSIVEERLRDRWPSFYIESEPQRHYPHGKLAAHLLGYMGELQEEDLQTPRARRYMVGDYIGKTGVEKVYEAHLRGEDGVRFFEVDARNRTLGQFEEREQSARPGRDLRLTIDYGTQRAAEAALPETMGGCVVALDARNGAVLAMASHPAYDPNVFVSFQAQQERNRLVQGGTNLLNRALRGQYPPGSTLKMIASVAALEEGLTDTLSTFEACVGSLQVGETTFHCFKRDGHGELNLLEATEVSCNIYFQHLAQIMDFSTWRHYAELFGLGQATGIDLDPEESAGLLPTRQYYREREGWTRGHLLNLVIGQGSILVTPLQMARYVAALGNGGYLVTPHVYGAAPPPRRIEGVSAATLGIVKLSMHRVVYGPRGTGRRVRIEGIDLAGKSGTAQVPNRKNDDAWFVAFAPYEDPSIAVAVVIEGGGGGGTAAAPVARAVIKAFFDGQKVAVRSKGAGT